jgi:type III pantothenate kinase
LLSAFAATSRHDPPAVIIDAGSAVTVDWVCGRRRFCGGAILPGLDLQSRALASGTEALPEIRWGGDHPIRLPAKNTEDAIRSGILAGMSASIDALIERYREAAGLAAKEIRVVLTGGDGPAISPHLRHIHQLAPNLVCRGLLDLPRSELERSGRGQ